MTIETPDVHVESLLEKFDSYGSYRRSKYLSTKHSSYFQVYDTLLSKYRHKKITFVEIGVFNGGSLFMWRDYFGPEVRIIGIDLNSIAKTWEKDGFEIYIGNQADPEFWERFFAAVGDVDVILDDGGHTNEHQIVTVHHCIPHIKDNGLMIVEDAHTSYMKSYGNPSRYSFMNYAKKLIDGINSRFPEVHEYNNSHNQAIFSINFFESIVCFNIDRTKCFVSAPTTNGGITLDAENYTHHGSRLDKARVFLNKQFSFLTKIAAIDLVARKCLVFMFGMNLKLGSVKLRKYFK